jgi:hypothetical protein
MSEGAPDVQSGSLGKRFVPSLALAFFVTGKLDILVSLFLVDIATTFLDSTDNTAAVGAASHDRRHSRDSHQQCQASDQNSYRSLSSFHLLSADFTTDALVFA